MNRQRGQGAAENRQAWPKCCGCESQRSHNNGANRQHGLNAGMSQNKHKLIILGCGIEIRKQSVFSSKDREKPPIKGQELTFSDLSRNQKTPTINLTKQMSFLEGVSRVSRRSPLSTHSLTPQNIPVVYQGALL